MPYLHQLGDSASASQNTNAKMQLAPRGCASPSSHMFSRFSSCQMSRNPPTRRTHPISTAKLQAQMQATSTSSPITMPAPSLFPSKCPSASDHRRPSGMGRISVASGVNRGTCCGCWVLGPRSRRDCSNEVNGLLVPATG